MQIARSLAEVDSALPSVVTIGNFDGVHCGHRAILASLIERARAQNARSVVVTFDPHPTHLLQVERRTPLLTPLARKLELLAATGVDLTVVLPFDEDLRRLTAREFARQILCESLHTLEIHEGANFRFGHRAEADIHGLTRLGQEFCFRVVSYQPVVFRGAAISSSRIRQLIAAGNVRTARALLGRPFAVDSTPAAGRGFGTRYAVPTINLAPYPELLPGHGVYITTLRIGEGATAVTFNGVTNAGNRPTFGADSYAVESHLFDFHPLELTPQTPLRLTFLTRLREERRFDSPDALRQQIALDVRKAQRYLRLRQSLQTRLAHKGANR